MGRIPDLAARRAQLAPDAPAFVDHETGRVWSFAQIDRAAAHLGAALLERVAPGARIGLLSLNRPEVFVALFACQKAGLILAPLNWRQPAAELAPVVAGIDCALILHDASFAGLAGALDPPSLPLEIPEDGPALAPADVDEEAPWYVLFTSGTTGMPKAVIQTPRMVVANAMNIAQCMRLTSDDRTLNYLPLFHTGGINLFTMPIFLWGGCTTVLRKFDAPELVSLIGQGAVTQFFGVPAIYQALMQMDLSAVDLASLRGWACGGAALPEATIRHFAERGALICNGFGMTETGPTGFLLDRDAVLRKVGSVGKPQFMTEARLDGVPDGQPGTGEIQLRGLTVTPGYLDNPEATRDAFTADGWLRSGDIGTRDAEGYYRVIDRIKDMYISGGENVYPAEVEKVLITHPDILDAAVIGIPDTRWGEVGAAFLIARNDRLPDPAALSDWLRERIAGYKLPRVFHALEDFPRTAAGKVRKTELRKLLP